MRDFTLNQYSEILNSVTKNIGQVFSVSRWQDESPERGVLLRHDVDRKPLNALKMARLEADKNISSTYYFRIVGSAYNPKIISEISEMGHEIGYHYEDLSLANGDMNEAKKMFGENLKKLRNLAEIKTVVMHGSPLSPHNNLDIWKIINLHEYALKADAFNNIDYTGVPYFTDTGRSWAGGSANLRDKPLSAIMPPKQIKDSKKLINFIEVEKPKKMALSAHPERWSNDNLDWCLQLGKDRLVNSVKITLSLFR